MEFDLTKEIKIYLYGAGTLGSIIGKYLLDEHYNVVGYIDKRSSEIQQMNHVKVLSLSDMNEVDQNHAKYCIIVTVKDVFDHENIKHELFKLGYRNIIYRPQAVLDGAGNRNERYINSIYDKIINKCLTDNLRVPFAIDEMKIDLSKNRFLFEDEEYCMVYIPCELIYTNYDATDAYTWGDICSIAMVPHIELFRFFAGYSEYTQELYIEFCKVGASQSGIGITDLWELNVLRNRRNVFNQMMYYWSTDRDFFVRNAPEAEWNKGGYYNLKSGKHRVAFLIAQGSKYIACKISKEDFYNWKNRTMLDKFIKHNKSHETNQIIENPAFLNQRCGWGWLWQDILYQIEFWICKLTLSKDSIPQFKRKKFLDLTENECYITRNLLKFGLKVARNGSVRESDKCINSLLYLSPKAIENHNESDEYDYALLGVKRELDELVHNLKSIKAKYYFVILDKNADSFYDKLNAFSLRLLSKNFYDNEILSFYIIWKHNKH